MRLHPRQMDDAWTFVPGDTYAFVFASPWRQAVVSVTFAGTVPTSGSYEDARAAARRLEAFKHLAGAGFRMTFHRMPNGDPWGLLPRVLYALWDPDGRLGDIPGFPRYGDRDPHPHSAGFAGHLLGDPPEALHQDTYGAHRAVVPWAAWAADPRLESAASSGAGD